MGRANEKCPKLKAGGEIMKCVDHDSYLGDLIDAEGKLSRTIASQKKKGVGIISGIMGILQDLCLGNSHYFDIAMILRNLLFINGILCSSEAWSPLTEKDLSDLILLDKILLRRFLQVPVSVSSSLIYLELGAVPLQLSLIHI